MGSIVDFAKTELKYLIDSEEPYDNMMASCVLELLKTFEDQGHSGFSAPWCIGLFSRLAKFKPLNPLTGADDEWIEVSTNLYQNKRYSAVFKEGNDGKAYNIEGKIFSNDGGETWFTNKDSIVYIDFPYNVPEKPEKVYLEAICQESQSQ